MSSITDVMSQIKLDVASNIIPGVLRRASSNLSKRMNNSGTNTIYGVDATKIATGSAYAWVSESGIADEADKLQKEAIFDDYVNRLKNRRFLFELIDESNT